MANHRRGVHHLGNQPMPCLSCGHQSRDHMRNYKQPDGTWNGACGWPNCNCKLYKKPRILGPLKP